MRWIAAGPLRRTQAVECRAARSGTDSARTAAAPRATTRAPSSRYGFSASLPISSTNRPSAGFQGLCQRIQRARSASTARPGSCFRYCPEPGDRGASVARSNSASSIASGGSAGAGQPIAFPWRRARDPRTPGHRSPARPPPDAPRRRKTTARAHARSAGRGAKTRASTAPTRTAAAMRSSSVSSARSSTPSASRCASSSSGSSAGGRGNSPSFTPGTKTLPERHAARLFDAAHPDLARSATPWARRRSVFSRGPSTSSTSREPDRTDRPPSAPVPPAAP